MAKNGDVLKHKSVYIEYLRIMLEIIIFIPILQELHAK